MRLKYGLSVAAFALLAQDVPPSRAQTTYLVPGIDYVPGELILSFREHSVPSDSILALWPGRIGVPGVDQVLTNYGTSGLKRLLPRREPISSTNVRRLERTFVVRFTENVDPMQFVMALRDEQYFDYVIVNRIVEREYYSLARWEPSTSSAFDEQWYFDSPNDKLDIDMPEAWAIERGRDNVVIVINDSGTMVDGFDPVDCTDPSAWNIHGDFLHLWLSGEDLNSPGVLKSDDIDGDDDDGDGVKDNIIGANFAPGVVTAPGCQVALWHAIPNNMWLTSAGELPTSWSCFGHRTHGVRVGGIAAAKATNAIPEGDVVGAANGCKVYWTRAGFFRHAKVYCRRG